MSQLHFTRWELDSRIGKVEREIMARALESSLVDAIAVGNQGRREGVYTSDELVPAIAIAVWFVKGKVSISREEVHIYDQYLMAETESVFAGLTFSSPFPTPSPPFSLVRVFGCTS